MPRLTGTTCAPPQVVGALSEVLHFIFFLGDEILKELGPAAEEQRKSWGVRCSRFSGLPRKERERRLRSAQFWEQEVTQCLLPLVSGWAAQAAVPVDELEARLRLARAASVLPCANPGCTNLSGCSEGRLRGRWCSGCRAVRFCCSDCQGAAWGSHALVCGLLSEG
jgi:hypothetical protein